MRFWWSCVAVRLSAAPGIFFFSSRRRHTRLQGDWSSDVCSSDLADVLLVATPGGPGTRHLINTQVLDALGPQGHLVNIARGSVVDTAALAAAVREGRLAGAGLDVYESEQIGRASCRERV